MGARPATGWNSSPIATRLMEKTLSTEEPGFISLVVLAEVVLRPAASAPSRLIERPLRLPALIC
jgi:hypothetical protein